MGHVVVMVVPSAAIYFSPLAVSLIMLALIVMASVMFMVDLVMLMVI